MEKISKKFYRRAFLILALFLFFGHEAFAQEVKNKVDQAVKEAQAIGIPNATLNQLLAMGYENQVESDTMAGFIQILIDAQREGLPLEPFTNKIGEGLAKRAPRSAIQQVLIKKMEDYRFTQSLLNEFLKDRKERTAGAEYLIRLSECLSSGISREDFRNFLGQAPPSSNLSVLTMSVEMMTTLRQNGFDSKMAQQIALSGLKGNYFTPERRDFVRVLVVAKKKGFPDEQIVAAATETIHRKGSPQEMASRLGIKPDDLTHGPSIGIDRSGRESDVRRDVKDPSTSFDGIHGPTRGGTGGQGGRR